MILKHTLNSARRVLTANNIEDASLECELLLRQALAIDRVQLYLDLDRKLSYRESNLFWSLIKRRIDHEPTAYIREHREFFGLDFFVDPRVMIPRPESELLVEETWQLARNQSLTTLVDVGTGCGAIAISLALHLPQVKIYATDISAPALEVAAINCQKHEVADRICLLQGNILEPLPQLVELIVANLPYIRDNEIEELSPEVRMYEPWLALVGGDDGMDKIGQLLSQSADKLRDGGSILLELGACQAPRAVSLAKGCFPSASVELLLDPAGISRILKISRL
jgi:release factor glutamine methyltransferase